MILASDIRALQAAAVSGIFTPDDLIKAAGLGRASAEYRDALWRDMSGSVTEVFPERSGEEREYCWFLLPDARRAGLGQLLTSDHLERALLDAPPPRQGDEFGRALRRILAGQNITIELAPTGATDEQLLQRLDHFAAILDAAQFAAGIPALDREIVADVERRAKHAIQHLQRRRDLTIVLPRPHHGYDEARKELSRFLRGMTPDPRPIMVTGIGGAGKSALLARVMQHWQNRRNAPVTLILDFDRRHLASGEPVEIVREMLRQLETGIAGKVEGDTLSLSRGIKATRNSLPKYTATHEVRTHLSQMGYLASETFSRFAEDWAVPLRDLPIAAIFDSFEAIDRKGGAVIANILDLERQLREAGLGGLRTVVSGRAEPIDDELMSAYFGWPERGIVLEGLKDSDGERLLAAEDSRIAPDGRPRIASADLYRRASSALSGHPMSLLLFARYAHERPEDAEALVEELSRNGRFRAAFAQQFLYERTLERIDDPELQPLAHPGLVLRELDADLLRLVLAGPCLGRGPNDEHPLSEAEARDLLDRLGDLYWLVDAGDRGGTLRHRSDLRRLMLPALFAEPEEDDSRARADRKRELKVRALEVCDLARAYYLDGPAEADARERWDALSPADRRAHALYYCSFLDPHDPPPLSKDDALAFELTLGEDVDTMPPAWSALTKVRLGREISEEERDALPDDLSRVVAAREFEQRMKTGAFSAVGGAPGARPADPAREQIGAGAAPTEGRAEGAGADDPEVFEREIRRGFVAAEFDASIRSAEGYLRALGGRDPEETLARFREGERDGYWRHPVWHLILLAGAGRLDGIDTQAMSRRPDYGPVVGALEAAAKGDAAATRKALEPVLSRELLSPVDRNRMAGAALTRAWESKEEVPVSFDPSGLCLAASPREGSFEELARLLTEEDVGRFMPPAPISRERSLADLGMLYRESHGAEAVSVTRAYVSERGPLLGRVLRGLNPEFYDPLTALLMQLPPVEAMRLAGRRAEEARFWPTELRFGVGATYRPHQAATIVETADQCGILRELAVDLASRVPEAATVVAMYDWITALFYSVLEMGYANARP